MEKKHLSFTKYKLYATILLLLAVNLFYGMFHMNTVKRELYDRYTLWLASAESIIEKEFAHIDRLTSEFLRSIPDMEKPESLLDDSIKRYMLYKSIESFLEANDFIDSIYIYHDNGENVYYQSIKSSGVLPLVSFHDSAAYEQIMKQEASSVIMFPDNDVSIKEGDNPLITLYRNIPVNSLSTKNAAAFNLYGTHFYGLVADVLPVGSCLGIKTVGEDGIFSADSMERIYSLSPPGGFLSGRLNESYTVILLIYMIIFIFALLTTSFEQNRNINPPITNLIDNHHMRASRLTPGHTSNKDIIDRVRNHIDHHYMESISLEAIAEHVFFSPSYLGKLFKEHTGRSFTEYVYEVRMTVAGKILLGSNMKISDIAQKVGYSTVQSFNKAFKKYYDCSPGIYRKSSINKTKPL
jgi:AraC-like DNA-binding protein